MDAHLTAVVVQPRHNRPEWRARGFAIRLLLMAALGATLLHGQGGGQHNGEPSPLPVRTGDALTIAPVDLPDVDCSIQEWNTRSREPQITLLCPPVNVFAPIRVYLKLSWLKPEDVPEDVGRIVALPNTSTRIRTNKKAVSVRLNVAGEPAKGQPAKWVDFTGVVDVALITDSRRSRAAR